MADKKAVDALKTGDTIYVPLMPGTWLPVTLTEQNREDGKSHVALLVERYGYENLRLTLDGQ